jgi:ORF6N domain
VAKKLLSGNTIIVPIERIEQKIYLMRGHRVMLDADLAALYHVPTKAFNQAVQRNLDRFPGDFMFQLSKGELANWRSQIVTSNPAAKMGLRRPPYAFTEHGVAMLSSVLRSKRAVQMNILIIRAFVKLRQLIATHKELAQKIDELERRQEEQSQQLSAVYSVVKQIIDPPPRPKRRIGFHFRDKQIEGSSD